MHHGLRGMHAPVLCLSLALSSRVSSCLYLKSNPGMLILVLVLVLKDIFKVLVFVLVLGGQVLVLILVLVV